MMSILLLGEVEERRQRQQHSKVLIPSTLAGGRDGESMCGAGGWGALPREGRMTYTG